MKLFDSVALRGTTWTTAGYGATQIIKLIAHVTIARLLSPELLGILLIVTTVRTSAELFSDFGIGQNIVYSKDSNVPAFLNTAWTLQLLRGLALWTLCFAATGTLTAFYDLPILGLILPVAAIQFVLAGATSMSPYLLQKQLRFARLNVFEFVVEAASILTQLLFVYVNPTIWSLVLGGLIGTAARTIGSYLVLPDVRYRLHLSRIHLWAIVGFGKWIFLSTLVYFLSSNWDRIYFSKMLPLELLGTYGIARGLSEMFGSLISRLGNYVIFPIVASSKHSQDGLRGRLVHVRLVLLVALAVPLSFFAVTGDLFIQALYDSRYQAAGWMLPFLLVGIWFSVLTTMNESIMLGVGKPFYSAAANLFKLAYLGLTVPFCFVVYGVGSAILAITFGDVCRYGAILFGQIRTRMTFLKQDLAASAIFVVLIGFWLGMRYELGFGNPFERFPGIWLN